MPSLNTLLLVIVFELISSSHPRSSHHMHLHFILNHSSPNHLQLAHSPLGPLAKPCCLAVEISITICTFIHPRTNTSKLVQGKKKKKRTCTPFKMSSWFSRLSMKSATFQQVLQLRELSSLHPGLSGRSQLLACKGWPAFTGFKTTLSPTTI